MNQYLSSFLSTVVASVVSGLILYWITGERAPTAPAYHYYLIVPGQSPGAVEDAR